MISSFLLLLIWFVSHGLPESPEEFGPEPTFFESLNPRDQRVLAERAQFVGITPDGEVVDAYELARALRIVRSNLRVVRVNVNVRTGGQFHRPVYTRKQIPMLRWRGSPEAEARGLAASRLSGEFRSSIEGANMPRVNSPNFRDLGHSPPELVAVVGQVGAQARPIGIRLARSPERYVSHRNPYLELNPHFDEDKPPQGVHIGEGIYFDRDVRTVSAEELADLIAAELVTLYEWTWRREQRGAYTWDRAPLQIPSQ